MKLLLIGFHHYDSKMYPHLKCFIDQATGSHDLAYFHLRERGYFAQRIHEKGFGLHSLSIGLRALLTTTIDAAKLWFRHRDRDTVIAIDHFAYAVACRVFKKRQVILWSFDIIGDDTPVHGSFFAQLFLKPSAKSLARNKRVIIQDPDRLELLARSLAVDAKKLDVFYMPVSLDATEAVTRTISSSVRPRLMQSGGIGKYRSSDKLLAHYQTHHADYRLYLHGFLFPEIDEQLRSSTFQPLVSTRTIDARQIHHLTDLADIGFISYEDEDSQNFFLLSHASGQLVEFLRVGIPVIVMGKNNLPRFCQEQGIGLAITDMAELGNAIKSIMASYSQYSSRCRVCFKQNFDLAHFTPRMLDWL